MPILSPNSVSILPPDQRSGGSLKEKALALKNHTQARPDAALWSTVGEALANAQSQIDHISGALRDAVPQPQVIQIVDPTGALVAEIGNLTGTNNQSYPGIWGKNIYVGGGGPDTAPLFSDGQRVIMGQNGQVYILDPYGNVGAWLGTQSEALKTVTNAANNGAGHIRITVAAHGYQTGDNVSIASVGGVPNANGNQWIVTRFDANNFDLNGSTFAGAYTSGGTSQRFYSGGAFSTVAVGAGQTITNVVNNGSGLARVTITAHGYQTGYAVVITGVVGVTGVNGFAGNITVIDPDTFDLPGTVFGGAYVSGGQSINWPTAKLIARDDGSLSISNATITLAGSLSTITLDPTTGSVTVVGVPGPPFDRTTIASGVITIDQTGAGANTNKATITADTSIQITSNSNQFGVELFFTGQILTITDTQHDVWANRLIGYSSATVNGPLMLLQQLRGTPTSHSASLSGDILGEFGGSAALDLNPLALSGSTGSMRVVAAQNQSNIAQGTRLAFTVTPIGLTTPSVAMTLDQNGRLGVGVAVPTVELDVGGDVNVSSGYMVAGVPGINAAENVGNSLTVNTGTAITSVNFGASSTTSDTFVMSVSLNVTPHTWTKGILTA